MKVNSSTKQGREIVYDFFRKYWKGTTLFDVYTKPSAEKIATWRQIENDCCVLNGWNLHITGASCYFYSCVYAFREDDIVIIRKETHGGTYDVALTEAEYVEVKEILEGI